jgi:DUF4097 and DUF4098 domain-containing protein YvlB
VSARKIAFLILIVLFAASVETAWNVREHVDFGFGPQGCRVMGGRFYGPSWSFEASGERPVTASALRLEVENAFGGVSVVKGARGVVKARLRKVVFLPTEERARQLADRIELRLTGDADVVKVATNRDELGRHDDVGFETHLEIEAPEGTAVQVRSEHGKVELSDVAAADVTASFDGVTLERVAGDATLEVRHGSVSVERVGGRLQLSSRHGDVTLAGVGGPAKLELQHGNLGVRETSALEVELAYGELTAERVAGDLVVRSQHAPVTASDVTGRAEVETSFGSVRLERIGGDARVKVEHGHVAATDISGGFTGEASFDGVELERVRGPVELKVQHGGVEAKGLESGARVRASGDDVTLEGFAGAIDVEVERGSARLAPGAAIKADVIASATHGNVALEVPDGSAFHLEAESHRGQVDAELAGLSAQRDEGRRHGQHVQGQQGAGGPQVRLTADGDVSLDARPARAVSEGAVEKPRVSTAEAPAKPPSKASASPAAKPTPSAEATPKTPESPDGTR